MIYYRSGTFFECCFCSLIAFMVLKNDAKPSTKEITEDTLVNEKTHFLRYLIMLFFLPLHHINHK